MRDEKRKMGGVSDPSSLVSHSKTLNPELEMVREFLGKCLPFSELAAEQLGGVAAGIEIVYAAKGSLIEPDGGPNDLRILRSGAVDIHTAKGELLDRLGEYESVNINGLAEEEPGVRGVVIDDSLIYLLRADTLARLRARHRQVDRFFHGQRARRLRRAARYTDGTPELLTPVAGIIQRYLVSVNGACSVREAAQRMTEKRVSCLLVTEGDRLTGIFTDRDIRSRVTARGLSPDTQVAEVMTENPIGLDERATLFDAMMAMSENSIHHLPVMASGTPVSVITTTDLIRASQRDPVYLMQNLSRKTAVEGLVEVARELPALVLKLVKDGVRVNQVSRFLCAISDRITRRLLELGEQQLGPPPAEYAWLAFGSQARREIALGGDQDNAMVIANNLRPEDEDYFEKLATFVCDGLDACGYPYCRGGIMATNPLWRLPLANWRQTVSGWVRSPTDDAVMRVSIFFDIRCVAGSRELADQLQAHMLATASANTIFLAALARNALCNRPPLGFFRRFVLERNGEHRDMLDLKHRGIIPVVELARIHAIANQVTQVNTWERLDALAANKTMALKDARNLQDALNFVMQVRLEQQCEQLKLKGEPSNFVNPKDLGDMARKQLRDAFLTIHDGQESISQSFSAGTF